MKQAKSPRMLLLAAWLILHGLLPFLRVSIPRSGTAVPLLAVAAGILLLVGR
jgi:hypothetical protein